MITKSAENKKKFALNLIFTNSARSAWGHILTGAEMSGEPVVLLPSYIGFTEREGSGVFDPIEEASAGYRFYKVDDSLKVDLEDFSRIIKFGEVNIALVIHYFGFCRSDMNEIKKLCTQCDVILVEDCAHAFQLESNRPKLGNYGDYSFYSLHKYLATDSGGILKINSMEKNLPILPDAKRILPSILEQYAKTQFLEIENTRRKNFLLYEKLLSSLNNVEIMFELHDNDIPQSFPLRVKNNMREKLYFYLINNKMPVTALYYRLIEKIKIEDFPISFSISNEIMNLPVHQDVMEDDIERLCSAIYDFFLPQI